MLWSFAQLHTTYVNVYVMCACVLVEIKQIIKEFIADMEDILVSSKFIVKRHEQAYAKLT